jgi:hypothetical protein
MPIKLHEGDLGHLSGNILASWFIVNPRGPTAFAVGFMETPDSPWSLFYRWMHFSGGKTYVPGELDQEISAASGNFGHLLSNLVIGVHNEFIVTGSDVPIFAALPNFIRTNGNPDVVAAMKFLMTHASSVHKADWGREMYLLETYGSDFFGRAGEEARDAYEALKSGPQNAESQRSLKALWALHEQIDTFRKWEPGRYQSRPFSEALFERWWTVVTDRSFVEKATTQFALAWAGAVHNAKETGLLDRLSSGWTSFSDLARFYDDFHMPLLSPEIDDRHLLATLGFDDADGRPASHMTARSDFPEIHLRGPVAERRPLFKTDSEKFWKLFHTNDATERFAGLHWADDILICETLRYGIFNDQSMIEPLRQLYQHFVHNGVPEDVRRFVYEDIRDFVLHTKVSAASLLLFVVEEASRGLVSTAVIDYVSAAPLVDADPMSRPRDIVAAIQNAKVKNPGAAFGALLHLGDARVCKLILPLRDSLGVAEANEAICCFTGYLSSATIEFELSWLEKSNLEAALFGAVASGLVLQRRAAKVPLVMTGERPFPITSVTPEQQWAMQRWIPIEEYASHIAPRLYALEKSEPSPKVMPTVIAEWGLEPAG